MQVESGRPQKLGRYNLVRLFATGGMAEVYLAKAEGPGGFEKTLVVKRILPQFSQSTVFIKMFLAEARIAAQLDHPNIVQVFDFGEAEGSYYLAMEFVDGLNLHALLRALKHSGAALDLGLAARVVSLACEGLAYAHDFVSPETGQPQNLIHRDVSTDNIMVARTGAVKVLDFGIAKVASEDKTCVGALKGKIAYMPPEQIRGAELDRRVDVYALGVVLYQLACGCRPYDQTTDVSLIAAILAAEAVPPLQRRPDLPPELAAIIEKAMSPSRDARYADCRQLQDALEGFVGRRGEAITTGRLGQLASLAMASAEGEAVRPPSSSGSGSKPSRKADRPVPPPPPAIALMEETRVVSAGDLDEASVDEPVLISPLSDFVTYQPVAEPEPSSAEVSRLELAANYEYVDYQPSEPEEGPAEAVLELSERDLAAPAAEGDDEEAKTVIGVSQAVDSEGPAARTTSAPGGVATPLEHRHCPVGAAAVRASVQAIAAAERSAGVLRKLPGAASRLFDLARDPPARLREALAGVVDAALLADDHAALRKLLEGADARPGAAGSFSQLVQAELSNPLRMVWLLERWRASGLPAKTVDLRAWLSRLSPAAAPRLLWLVDSLEPGPGQDLICEVLAKLSGDVPAMLSARLEEAAPRSVAAVSYALDLTGSPAKGKVFQKLLLRRDPGLQMQLMTGRAKLGGPEAFALLEAGIGDRSEEVRLHALGLLARFGEKAAALLSSRVQSVSFEARSPAERAATWAALSGTDAVAALAPFEQVLGLRTTLLNKKRSLEAKLSALRALPEMPRDEAARLLDRVANDRGQPDEVVAAAKAALARRAQPRPVAAAAPSPRAFEQRQRLARSLVLDFLHLSRAATTIDLAAGDLEPAVSRFREEVRQVVLLDGKVHLTAGPTGVALNGVPVTFEFPAEDVGLGVARWLQSRDVRGFGIDAPLPAAELRSFLLRLYDPDGGAERVPHVRAATFSGRALAAPPGWDRPTDPEARAGELWDLARAHFQEALGAVAGGRLPSLEQCAPLLDAWAALYALGRPRFLGRRSPPGTQDAGAHAANTAVLAMAFASDLGLGQAHLRDLAEVALFHRVFAAGLPRDKRPPEGEPIGEESRLRAAMLFLSQLRSRRGPAYALATLETGVKKPAGAFLAPVVSLADAWNGLTVGRGLPVQRALERLATDLADRAGPEVAGLFAEWQRAQLTAPTAPQDAWAPVASAAPPGPAIR